MRHSGGCGLREGMVLSLACAEIMINKLQVPSIHFGEDQYYNLSQTIHHVLHHSDGSLVIKRVRHILGISLLIPCVY